MVSGPTLSIATSRRWNNAQGQQQEKTEWHRVICWDKLAEICERFLKRGDRIYVEGSIEYRQWEDKDGQTKYTTETWVRSVKETLGRIAFMVVSELNKEGNLKGGQLDYKADLALRIQKIKDEKDMVQIDITHSRSTRGGDLGRFYRDWPTGRFDK